MTDFVETLWQEFGAESDEHLAVLEPLLVRLGTAEGEVDDVARAFRGFHSLKGLSRAMSLHGMEAVAHRTENLLGLVRDAGAAMTEPMLDGLLEAVDCLKGQRDAAIRSRADSEAPAALLQRLDALFEAAGGSEAAAEPAQLQAAQPSGLGDDEMLGIFAELLQSRLPELARAFDADEGGRNDLVDTLDSLQHAAEVMEFDQVGETVGGLKEFLSAQSLPLDPAARVEATDRIAQVALQARLLNEVVGGDAGAAGLSEALAGVLGEDRRRALVDLASALGALERSIRDRDPGGFGPAITGASALAHAAGSILQCLAAEQAAELLLLIEDVCSRVARGEAPPTEPVASLMRLAVEAVTVQADLGRDLDSTQAGSLTQRIRDALATDTQAGDAPQVGQLLSGFKDRPEVMGSLSTQNVGDLAAGVAAGANVFELMLFLEESPAIGEALVGWLTAETKVISNRTALTNGQSWFDFLILSPHPPEAVRDAMLAIDPQRQCVKSLRHVGGEVLLAGDENDEAAASDSAASEEGPAAARDSQAGTESRNSTVLRVRSDVIDRFMTRIGEIRIVAAELADATVAPDDDTRRQGQRGAAELARVVETDLRRLQAAALELRVVPIDTILTRFPRVVRALAQEQGKNVRLVLEGRDVRVDKSMVELLVDPLMHMVRNAVDHGIERPEDRTDAGKPAQATVTMAAMQRGGEIQVRVSDDGRGLNAAAILDKAMARGLVSAAEAPRLKLHDIYRFIFGAGFSTAAKVTETSGRGVGMDVVLTTVQQLGGDIDVETELGQGTTFTLRLPLSAAMQATLMVRVNGQSFGIAERLVSSVLEVPAEEMLETGGQATIRYKGMALPVYRLADLLWQGAVAAPADRPFRSIVVVSNGRETIGLEVDRVRRRLELFLKDLHPLLAACPTVSGAAVLGDGRIVLLLDADELIQLVRSGSWRGAPRAEAAQ
jgi:two-component system chemotaxis sensor kinase CheA